MLLGDTDSGTLVKIISGLFLTVEFVILFRLGTIKIAQWLERRDINRRLAAPEPVPIPEPAPESEPVPIPKGRGRRYPSGELVVGPMPAKDVGELVAKNFVPEAWAAEALIALEESQVKMACLYNACDDSVSYMGTKLKMDEVATCRTAADLQELIERTRRDSQLQSRA